MLLPLVTSFSIAYCNEGTFLNSVLLANWEHKAATLHCSCYLADENNIFPQLKLVANFE